MHVRALCIAGENLERDALLLHGVDSLTSAGDLQFDLSLGFPCSVILLFSIYPFPPPLILTTPRFPPLPLFLPIPLFKWQRTKERLLL